ncbi:MAG TPA: YcaO-like family protein [Myxococcales bacterium]|nr:YcaO-like family protein [Myxococcales bacterium]
MNDGFARLIGVTRVGRVTGLDRAGVEVACAVRPRGHVLQVANGKGRSWEEARRAALGEAAELWAAERVAPEELLYGTPAGMRARFGAAAVWDGDLGSAGSRTAPELWGDRIFCAFRAGRNLFSGTRVFAPAAALHCPPPGSPPIGPRIWQWTSNGMGAHVRGGLALRHALLEAIERDQLARSLPEGWTEQEMERRAVAPASLPEGLRRWQRHLATVGLHLWLFDLTPTSNLGVPVAGALLLDDGHAPVPLTAGYACRLEPREALLAAFFEAAQSRLTDIHGAREDVAPMAPGDLRRLCAAVARVKPRRTAAALPAPPQRAGTDWLLHRLQRAGHRRVAAFELAPPGFPGSVVKIVAPSLLRSALL